MKFCLLASGSKGNSTFIETPGARVLIDAGLSARGMVARLAELGIDPMTIDAVIITHEHDDHVKGLDVWCKRFGTMAYMTEGTHKALRRSLGTHVRSELFHAGSTFNVSSIRFTAFSTSHDAAEPVGLLIETNGSRMGIATDLGCATALVKERLRRLDAVILESNHDIEMLMEGPYPWHIKERIRRNCGHLSNDQSSVLLKEIAHDGLKTVALAHLSEINNRPELARCAASEALRGVANANIHVAFQGRPGEMITV